MATPIKNQLTLISHKLCPYVQRAVIALEELGVEYKRIDIDLDNTLPDIDDSGTLVSVGVRWQLIKMLEINGFSSLAYATERHRTKANTISADS